MSDEKQIAIRDRKIEELECVVATLRNTIEFLKKKPEINKPPVTLVQELLETSQTNGFISDKDKELFKQAHEIASRHYIDTENNDAIRLLQSWKLNKLLEWDICYNADHILLDIVKVIALQEEDNVSGYWNIAQKLNYSEKYIHLIHCYLHDSGLMEYGGSLGGAWLDGAEIVLDTSTLDDVERILNHKKSSEPSSNS